MKRTFPILVLAAQCIAATQSKAGAQTGPAQIEAQVKSLAERIRKAVLARDIEGLVALMNPEGLECGDSLRPLDRVREELKTPGSFLHAWFFDSRELEKGWTGKIQMHPSLLEFFRNGKGIRMDMGFSTDENGKPWLERPDVNWRAENMAWVPGFSLFSSRGRVVILGDPWCDG